MKDFFQSNWTIVIVGGVAVAVIIGAFSFVSNQGIQGEKVSGLETRVGKVEEKVDELTNNISGLNTNLNGIKIEFGKDIEYIKEKLSGKN